MKKTNSKVEKTEKNQPSYPSVSDGIVRGYQVTLTVEQTQQVAAFIAKSFFDDVVSDAITNSPNQQLKIYGNKKFMVKS